MRPDGSARRDLPPGAGPLARAHALAGDILIRLADLRRPRLMLGVRLVAFDAAGRVFLVRHSYRPGWHLPGGGVEAGETARRAVRREAAEEGGLILGSEPVLFHLYAFATVGRRDHIVLFVARGASARTAAPGLEIRDSGFFAPEALPEWTTGPTRARIREVLGGTEPPDRW